MVTLVVAVCWAVGREAAEGLEMLQWGAGVFSTVDVPWMVSHSCHVPSLAWEMECPVLGKCASGQSVFGTMCLHFKKRNN